MWEVENRGDFIKRLGPVLAVRILTHLDDPCDLVRVSTVSSSWHRFVVENGLCKQLCLKVFPELSGVANAIEADNIIEQATFSNSMNWACVKRNHKVYAVLARGLTPEMKKNCISEGISASSTDNYPEESIQNTLEPRDLAEGRASYWSSKGQSDPSVPETLIYRLIANLCVVTQIHIQPFQAFFQFGLPIYSAKAVRFRMGYPKHPIPHNLNNANHMMEDSEFIWTYTSPEFQMARENKLQKFKLPEPAVCIGGVMLVELLGRVQKQEMDGLFYICISHVEVVGRPLSPAFDVEIHHPSRKCTFKYWPQTD